MQFDVHTLYFTNIVVLFITAITAFAYWLRHRDQIALQQWALATAAGGAGTLVLGVFGPVPTIGPGIVGNTLVVAGVVLAWESMRRFNGQPAADRRVIALILGFLIGFSVAWLLGADVRARVIIGSLALALYAFLAAREIMLGGQGEQLSGRATLGIIFSIVSLDMLIRAGHAAFEPPSGKDLAFFADPIQGHTLFAMTIGLVCLSIGGLSTMANERLLHRYERLALTDELTELPNRRFLLERGEQLARRAAFNGRPLAVLVMDLDRFADINERFGHAGGDQALRAFASLLRSHARPTDLAARHGGEEFCALLPDTDTGEAAKIAERLRTAVAGSSLDVKGQPMTFTVSIGLASVQDGDLLAAIDRADKALYRAKRAGRNQVAVAAKGTETGL
jgi:diguanylate cyclase (GGDEF)-like protein